MTGLFNDLFENKYFTTSDPAGAAQMNEDDLIKLEMQRRRDAQDSWDRLSDKEKLHYRALMGGAAATEKEKN